MAEEFDEPFVAKELKLLADFRLNMLVLWMKCCQMCFVRVNVVETKCCPVKGANDV